MKGLGLTTTRYRKARERGEANVLLVHAGNSKGPVVGLLRKSPNTAYETCPWQAFGYDGMLKNTLLGCFYGYNGRRDALQAVADCLLYRGDGI